MSTDTKRELSGNQARYVKGVELFEQGRVSQNDNGTYKVNGRYTVELGDPNKCDCPDFQNRGGVCKHVYAAIAFKSENGSSTKNKSTNGKGNIKHTDPDKQATITRLALLNTATEILKTYENPIKLSVVFETAMRLENWVYRTEQ